ncbi:hypothetical protein PCC82_18605 [Agrobacterium deltaense]
MLFKEIEFYPRLIKDDEIGVKISVAAGSALGVDNAGLLRGGIALVAPGLRRDAVARRWPVIIAINLEIAPANRALRTAASSGVTSKF